MSKSEFQREGVHAGLESPLLTQYTINKSQYTNTIIITSKYHIYRQYYQKLLQPANSVLAKKKK